MILRQSQIDLFMQCPLKYRYTHVDKVPQEQSCALTFGTLIHAAIQIMEEQDSLDAGLDMFKDAWADPEKYDPELKIDYFLPRRTPASYLAQAENLMTKWKHEFDWDPDQIIAREHQFTVPLGDSGHHLTGTVDRLALRYSPRLNRQVVVVQDYKTNKKKPAYDYLRQNIQLTAYSYASEQPEFWESLPDGQHIFEQVSDIGRETEWIWLMGPARLDGGERNANDYARLMMAVQAMTESIDWGIYMPDISGATCTFCEFRGPCGIETIEDEGYMERVAPRLYDAIKR